MAWCVATVFIIGSSIWLNYKGILDMFVRPGPHSILGQNMMAALIVWLLFGLTILLIHTEKLNRENTLTYAGFPLVS